MRLAYAGSFNPFTVGHEYVVNEALKIADSLVIIIAANSSKKNTVNSSLEFVNAWLSEYPDRDRIEVVTAGSYELSADIAIEHGCVGFIRGIRNMVDFEYEKELAHVNGNVVGQLSTYHVIAPASLISVSSSQVRNLTGVRNWWNIIKEYLPTAVYELYVRSYCKSFGLPVSDRVWEFYASKHYHSFDHVLNLMYQIIRDHGANFELLAAALYHDSAETVEESVEIMKEELHIRTSIECIARIGDYILSTKYDGDFVPNLFTDYDLNILAVNTIEYREYIRNVRAEYRDRYTDSEFVAGRKAVLEKFISFDRIFLNSQKESKARNNINAELREYNE